MRKNSLINKNICAEWSKKSSLCSIAQLLIYSCADCHQSCATCNGSSESQCIQCKPNRFSFDGKCLNVCPDGHFGDKKRKECLPVS